MILRRHAQLKSLCSLILACLNVPFTPVCRRHPCPLSSTQHSLLHPQTRDLICSGLVQVHCTLLLFANCLMSLCPVFDSAPLSEFIELNILNRKQNVKGWIYTRVNRISCVATGFRFYNSLSDCLWFWVCLGLSVCLVMLHNLNKSLHPPCKDRKFRGSAAECMPSVLDENTHWILTVTFKLCLPCLMWRPAKMSPLDKVVLTLRGEWIFWFSG